MSEKILKRAGYGTRVDGTNVVMTLGNKEVTMEYQVALTLAAFLHHSGKQAKRAAGDFSRRMIGIGTLTDANLDELQAQRSRDGTAVYTRN